ncbi:hypothetical protein Tco_0011076 [Tanacetum coccineum]
MQTQEDHSNPIPALNVDSLKVDLVVIQNTCSEKEDSNSETASSKLVKECSLNSETKDVHAIKYKMSKAKERCMAYFRSLHSHLQVLSKDDLKGTRIEHGFKRAFMSLFGQDVDTFTRNKCSSTFNTSEIHYSNTWVMLESVAERTRHQDSMKEGKLMTGLKPVQDAQSSRSGMNRCLRCNINPFMMKSQWLRAQVDQGSQIKMIQVKEMMQDKGSRTRSQSMNEQSHYKQDKTKTRQCINVKSHIFKVRGDNDKSKQTPTRMSSVANSKYQNAIIHVFNGNWKANVKKYNFCFLGFLDLIGGLLKSVDEIRRQDSSLFAMSYQFLPLAGICSDLLFYGSTPTVFKVIVAHSRVAAAPYPCKVKVVTFGKCLIYLLWITIFADLKNARIRWPYHSNLITVTGTCRRKKSIPIQKHMIKKSTAESRLIVPRKHDKDKKFTFERMGRQLSDLGLEPSKALDRVRSKSRGRKKERSSDHGGDEMDVDNDGSNKKLRLRSLSRSDGLRFYIAIIIRFKLVPCSILV